MPPDDPRAVHSRHDLRRLNRIMGHSSVLAAALTNHLRTPPRRLADIGAGDGTLMLQLAAQTHQCWPYVHVTLVDQQTTASAETKAQFAQYGWEAEIICADIFDWLNQIEQPLDAIIANLFLHHFGSRQLAVLMHKASEHSHCFVACEPSRDWFALAASSCVGVIGCNAVTRHDARLSVKSGFAGNELSDLWLRNGWKLQEQRAGLFTHLFAAHRNGATT